MTEGEFEGTADRVPPPHHVGFNRALEKAVAEAVDAYRDSEDWAPGETRTFSVGLVVDVVRTNPGWIGGYTVALREVPPG